MRIYFFIPLVLLSYQEVYAQGGTQSFLSGFISQTNQIHSQARQSAQAAQEAQYTSDLLHTQYEHCISKIPDAPVMASVTRLGNQLTQCNGTISIPSDSPARWYLDTPLAESSKDNHYATPDEASTLRSVHALKTRCLHDVLNSFGPSNQLSKPFINAVQGAITTQTSLFDKYEKGVITRGRYREINYKLTTKYNEQVAQANKALDADMNAQTAQQEPICTAKRQNALQEIQQQRTAQVLATQQEQINRQQQQIQQQQQEIDNANTDAWIAERNAEQARQQANPIYR